MVTFITIAFIVFAGLIADSLAGNIQVTNQSNDWRVQLDALRTIRFSFVTRAFCLATLVAGIVVLVLGGDAS